MIEISCHRSHSSMACMSRFSWLVACSLLLMCCRSVESEKEDHNVQEQVAPAHKDASAIMGKTNTTISPDAGTRVDDASVGVHEDAGLAESSSDAAPSKRRGKKRKKKRHTPAPDKHGMHERSGDPLWGL